MSRSKLRPRLRVLSLEARTVPTLFGAIDLGQLADAPTAVFDPGTAPPASITFDGGVVTATGTDDADVIRFDLAVPTFALFSFPDVTSGALRDRVRVTITDAAGTIRLDAAGNPLQQFFAADQVIRVDARPLGGNDTVVNTTRKTMDAEGGFGNDVLRGGPGIDFLRGDVGNDSLYGGAGNDSLDGRDGNDLVNGEAGNDFADGGTGNDTVLGGDGDDGVLGGFGTDQLGGGTGDDQLFGGDGLDILLGDNGNDVLHGDEGNDVLSGGAGNDSLYGGAGNDSLEGRDGNDGLFGGPGRDYLIGGAGIDRFLRWVAPGNQTTIQDKAANESLTTFKGTTSVTSDPQASGPPLRYHPGEWTEVEIEAADAGLGWLHADTGNTRLLRLKGGGNMTFVRYGTYMPYDTTDGLNDPAEKAANELGAFIAGANHGNGTIDVRQFPTDLTNAMRLVIHELAHNWQGSANPKWAQWLGLSGWVHSSTPGAGQVLSTDGKWVYDPAAEFARDYGKTNPYEDFATAFEAYFLLKTGRLPDFAG